LAPKARGSVYLPDSAKSAFDIILQVGAGTGLLYLLRWFWSNTSGDAGPALLSRNPNREAR
jgi:hypothetical protein